MSRALRVHRTGGPEVLQFEDVEVGAPGPGEVRLRHTAIGLNFIDVYHRTGLYPQPLPFIPGVEAAGVVDAVGAGVTELAPGDRVAYVMAVGAYAEHRLMPADRLLRIPAGIDDRAAAAVMLKGMTAQFLLRRTCRVEAGDTILVHAAAGGVGLILCQWARHLGATVIGTVSSARKAALARAHGCTHAIVAPETDFVAAVKELTAGSGVRVVYDSVGRDTFMRSLECLAPLGMLVLFGQSSGTVAPFDPGILSRGSLFLTRPTLATYAAKRGDLVEGSNELFAMVAAGHIEVVVNQSWPLAEAAQAHRELEARRTSGSSLLVP